MTSPLGASLGSTTTLKAVLPRKRWSRPGSLTGRMLPALSELVVLSRSRQVRPPSIERKKPTPGEPVSPSPVATKTIDWLGSLLRPKTAMLPVLRLLPGPRSVSGIQVGPLPSVVRKLVVFQTPPEAPAVKTVLPDGSEGSTARPPMRPEDSPL